MSLGCVLGIVMVRPVLVVVKPTELDEALTPLVEGGRMAVNLWVTKRRDADLLPIMVRVPHSQRSIPLNGV